MSAWSRARRASTTAGAVSCAPVCESPRETAHQEAVMTSRKTMDCISASLHVCRAEETDDARAATRAGDGRPRMAAWRLSPSVACVPGTYHTRPALALHILAKRLTILRIFSASRRPASRATTVPCSVHSLGSQRGGRNDACVDTRFSPCAYSGCASRCAPGSPPAVRQTAGMGGVTCGLRPLSAGGISFTADYRAPHHPPPRTARQHGAPAGRAYVSGGESARRRGDCPSRVSQLLGIRVCQRSPWHHPGSCVDAARGPADDPARAGAAGVSASLWHARLADRASRAGALCRPHGARDRQPALGRVHCPAPGGPPPAHLRHGPPRRAGAYPRATTGDPAPRPGVYPRPSRRGSVPQRPRNHGRDEPLSLCPPLQAVDRAVAPSVRDRPADRPVQALAGDHRGADCDDCLPGGLCQSEPFGAALSPAHRCHPQSLSRRTVVVGHGALPRRPWPASTPNMRQSWVVTRSRWLALSRATPRHGRCRTLFARICSFFASV